MISDEPPAQPCRSSGLSPGVRWHTSVHEFGAGGHGSALARGPRGLIEALRAAGARFAILHGSRAVGDARPDADYDVAAWWDEDPPEAFDVLVPSGAGPSRASTLHPSSWRVASPCTGLSSTRSIRRCPTGALAGHDAQDLRRRAPRLRRSHPVRRSLRHAVVHEVRVLRLRDVRRVTTSPSSSGKLMPPRPGEARCSPTLSWPPRREAPGAAGAYHAALALEHGCDWVSTDGDYARFARLELAPSADAR